MTCLSICDPTVANTMSHKEYLTLAYGLESEVLENM
jgi:hypothetical protein